MQAPASNPHALFPLSPRDAAAAAPSPLSAHELLVLLWRHRWLVALCVLAASAMALALAAAQQPLYTSSARVLVQTEQQGTPSFLSGITAYRESQNTDGVTRKIETEMELLRTRSSAQDVVRQLGLRREQFAASSLARLAAPVNRLLGRAPEASKAVANSTEPPLDELLLSTVTVQALRSKAAETASNVLEVSIESIDPVLAPKILQALIGNYLRAGGLQTQRLGEGTSQLLKTRLGEARSELQRLDDALVAQALRRGGPVETAAAMLPTAARAAGAPGGGLRLDLALDASRGGNAQAVTQLKSQTLELQQRLDEARQIYTDEADSVVGLRRRIDATRQRLETSVRAGVQAEAEFARIERERAVAQERAVELQRKVDQIELYLQLNPTGVDGRVVIDPPSTARRAPGRSRTLLALAGPLAGLLLGLLLAGVRELFDTRLRSRGEVEHWLGLPVLVVVGTLSPRERHQLLGASVTS